MQYGCERLVKLHLTSLNKLAVLQSKGGIFFSGVSDQAIRDQVPAGGSLGCHSSTFRPSGSISQANRP